MRLGGLEEDWEPGLALSALARQSQPGEETTWSSGALGWAGPPSVLAQLQVAGNPQKRVQPSPAGAWQPPQLPVGVAGREAVGSGLQGQHSPTLALQSPGRESQA